MRYAVILWGLMVAAAALTGCQQNQTSQMPQNAPSQKGAERQATDNPKPDGKPKPAGKPQNTEKPTVNKDQDAEEEPLLLLDEEPLLLLDDEPLLLTDDGGKAAGPVADNSRCHHCHLNYIYEDIALQHAKANIGCVKCHGKCDEHIADESWANNGPGTPPEIMYPKDKINPACLNCHAEDEIDEDEHKDFFAGKVEEKVCTDCHGNHRLTERKCKWK